jgi:hypothetical protein
MAYWRLDSFHITPYSGYAGIAGPRLNNGECIGSTANFGRNLTTHF